MVVCILCRSGSQGGNKEQGNRSHFGCCDRLIQLKQEPAKNSATMVIKLIYEMEGALAFVDLIDGTTFLASVCFQKPSRERSGSSLANFWPKYWPKLAAPPIYLAPLTTIVFPLMHQEKQRTDRPLSIVWNVLR
jgi:hypothetical protein